MTDYPQDLILEDYLIYLKNNNYKVIYTNTGVSKDLYMMNTHNKVITLYNCNDNGTKVDRLEEVMKQYRLKE